MNEEIQNTELVAEDKSIKMYRKVISYPCTVSIILSISAILYGSNLMTREMAENTRISEHALMPGIVIPTFDKTNLEAKFIRELTDRKDDESRSSYIQSQLNHHLIDSFPYEWTTTTPFRTISGLNTICLIRAYRSTGVEAIQVVIRLEDTHAVAMAMAIAVHARDNLYWSRDIYFIFVSNGEIGLNAYMEEYYGIRRINRTRTTTGSFIVGAIVLETPEYLAREYTVHVQVIGINGQLPNLDLFNSIARIGHRGRNQLNIMIYPLDETNVNHDLSFVPYRFLLTQAFTGVEGIHSVYAKYGVQAVTIRCPRMRNGNEGRSEYLIEGILRSMNNLHERFHQSYFLYILESPSSFISIAYYLPIVALLITPLLIFSLNEWNHIHSNSLSPHGGLPLLFIIGLSSILSIHPLSSYSSITETSMIRLLLFFIFLPFGLFIRISSSQLSSSRFFILILFSLILSSLSLINFGLGLFSSFIILFPIMIVMTPSTSKLTSFTRFIIILLFHPIFLMIYGRLVIISLQYSWWNHIDYSVIKWALTIGGPHFIISTLNDILNEFLILGSFQLVLLLLLAIPSWNSLLALSITVEGKEDKKEKVD